jgi:hypothetical protein
MADDLVRNQEAFEWKFIRAHKAAETVPAHVFILP